MNDNDDNIDNSNKYRYKIDRSVIIRHKQSPEYVVYGYVRENMPYNILIPKEILTLCLLFYQSYNVYGFGTNKYGELGVAQCTEIQNDCKQFGRSGKLGIVDVYSANHSTYFVKTFDNKIYCCGANEYAQLGLGHPIKIINELKYNDRVNFNKNELKIEFVSCGITSCHTFIMCQNNQIYAFGKNDRGQLGIGHSTNIKTMNYKTINYKQSPQLIKSSMFSLQIIDIKCGKSHTIFLTKSCLLYSCGSNRFGQCGQQNNRKDVLIPTLIKKLKGIDKVECANNFTMVLYRNGSIFAFGDHPYTTDTFKYFKSKGIIICNISSGGKCSCVLDLERRVYILRADEWKHPDRDINIKIDDKNFIDWNMPYLIPGLNNIKIEQLSCGYNHILLLSLLNNNIYSFGFNNRNQCSLKSNQQYFETPYLLTKQELGLKNNPSIRKIIAGHNSTVILVSQKTF